MKKTITFKGKDMRRDAQINQDDIMAMVYEDDVEHLRLDIGLTDDILIFNSTGISPKGYREAYKYIIIKHVHASTWHNNVDIIFTDDDDMAVDFEQAVYDQWSEEEDY